MGYGKKAWIGSAGVLNAFARGSPFTKLLIIKKQGRKHGNSVADGWAGAVMQKPIAIQKCDGLTDRLTDGPTDTVRCRVACPRLKTETNLKRAMIKLRSKMTEKRR